MANRAAVAAVLGVLLAITPGAFAQAPAPGSGDQVIKGRVRVIDGDTLEIFINGRQASVGLIGIKAPLGNTACGQLSARYLFTLLGQTAGLRLVEDLNHPYDSRKRRMYYLRLPNNLSAAVEMVRAGLAKPNLEGLEVDALLAAALEALSLGRGCVH